MKLKKVSIENFKCFGKQIDVDFGRISLFTGANSSGKSSIIYSVLGSLQSGEFPLQFSPNGKYVNMGDFKEIVHNHQRKEKIKFGFIFENGEGIEEINTVWCEDSKNSLPKLSELSAKLDDFTVAIKYVDEKKYVISFSYKPNISEDFKKINEAINEFINKTLSSSSNKFNPFEYQEIELNVEQMELDSLINEANTIEVYRLQSIISSISDFFLKYDNILNFISSFRLHPERTYLEYTKSKLKVSNFGEGYLDQIIYWETHKDPKFNELITNLKKIKLLDGIKSKRIGGGKYEVLVKTKKNGIDTQLSDVGFGVSQFLPIMVADLQLPKNSTLYIAQPEIHLHPSIQSSFGDYLSAQISSTKKNYVIETHSEYLINKIRLAIVKGKIAEDDVKVTYIDNEANLNTIHKIHFTKQGQIIGAPKSFFKTYMMDVMDIAINAAK